MRVASEIQLRKNSGKPAPHVAILDVSKQVLDSLRSRLSLALNGFEQQNFSFYEANAALRLPFDDSSIAAVTASSMVHELFSYGGGIEAIDSFAKEAARILRQDGLLIYRDPEGSELHELNDLSLKTHFSRGFFPFFSSKFLNRNISDLNRPDLDYADRSLVKRDNMQLDFASYLSNIPDFYDTRTIQINSLSGISKEFQRHFVLFCKDVVPEAGYIVVDEDEKFIKVRFVSLDSSSIFEQFCNPVETTNDGCYKVNKDDWLSYVEYVNEKIAFLFKPVELNIPNREALAEFKDFLSSNSIPFEFTGNTLVLAPSVCNLAYLKLVEISSLYGVEISLPERLETAFRWSVREGEEHYFYGSESDVIANFAKSSLIENDNDKYGFSCLCPLSASHSRFHARSDHTAFLNYHLHGDKILDGKRHIHFSKMPLEKAIPILSNLLSYSREQLLASLEVMP